MQHSCISHSIHEVFITLIYRINSLKSQSRDVLRQLSRAIGVKHVLNLQEDSVCTFLVHEVNM